MVTGTAHTLAAQDHVEQGGAPGPSSPLDLPSPFLPSPFESEGHLFRLDRHGRIHVLAKIDGQGPFDMLLDTGAGRTTINRSVVYRLGLEPHPFRTRQVRTATGLVTAQIFEIGGITALGKRLDMGTTPALGDPSSGERFGILGVDLMRGHILYVSHTGAGVRLMNDPAPFEQAGWQVYDGRPVGRGSLALDVSIGGVRLPAIIDTGASHSVVNRPAMEALTEGGVFFRELSMMQVATSAGSQQGLRLTHSEPQQINDTDWPITTVISADLPIFTFLGARQVPAMILGMDLLETRDFAMDLRGWRLFLRTDPETQPAAQVD